MLKLLLTENGLPVNAGTWTPRNRAPTHAPVGVPSKGGPETVADCAAPGLVLAQAIGRFGDYTNQALYGRPSGLPWAIRIDYPIPPYPHGQAFQPAFLYESLWDLAVFGVLMWFTRRTDSRLRPGTVFALYAVLYSLGRLCVETIRIDPTDHVFGQRVDIWVAGLVALAAGSAFAVLWTRRTAAPA